MKNRHVRILSIVLILALTIGMGNAFAVSEFSDEEIILRIPPVQPEISLFAIYEKSKDYAYTEMEFSALPLFNLTGKGVKVGVIDSGISFHNDLAGKIVESKSFATDISTEDAASGNGHGTSVAAIIAGQGKVGVGAAGIAPDAEIVNVRILEPDGTANMSVLVDAVDYCVQAGCDVINMSLGTEQEIQYDYTYYTVLVNLHAAIERAVSAGCIVIAAAGNQGKINMETDFVSYPAGFDNVIGVGATAEGKIHFSSSQKNSSVFVSAPGKNIYTATALSQTGYGYVSGTSFAAPIVSGIAALIKEANPNATHEDVRKILKATSVDLGATGYDYKFGNGLINGKNLAKYLRNSDIYAYFNEKGQAVCANLGAEKNISGYTAVYSGERNTSITETPFSLKYMEDKAIDLPSGGTVKQFFWEQNALTPICTHLVRQ